MYSIRNYGEMILDAPRMEAYERALRTRVTPGSVVADIGAGTGIFALIACRLGARRVFAIEPGEAITVAREMAAANGFTSRIEFFQAMSTEVTLPERANVIVSDLRGILPLFRRHLPSVVDARKRLLAAGGAMIPEQDELWLAIVESDDMHRTITRPWHDKVFGFDMTAGGRVMANNFCRTNAVAEQLLSAPQPIATLDFARIESFDLRAELQMTISRAGSAHGFVAWFDSTLAPNVRLSNAPGAPPLIYGNAFFPWPDAVPVDKGDAITIRIRADLVGDEYVWTWRSDVADASGRTKVRFDQSDFLGAIISDASLRKRGASHVPTLSEDGEVERFVLDHMEGRHNIGEIARLVEQHFPMRFGRAEDALAYVGDVAVRYSR